MAVKDRFEGVEWTKWAEDIRLRWNNAMDYYREELYFDIEFQQYMQFKFYEQWMKLKSYANSKGIQIIGDIPIYVAMDSADARAHPELFQLDQDNVPLAVAGCPPDGFSATGQLWGNPLYRWDYHRNTGYQWWISRMSYCFRLYDVESIISADLMNISLFHTEIKMQEADTGKRVPELICSVRLNKRLDGSRLSQRT